MNPMNKIAKLCERRPHLVVAAVAIVTLLLLPGIPKITAETKMETFIPKDYPSIIALSDVEKTFGGMRYESILIETKNGKVTDADAIKSLLGLQQKILAEPALKEYAVEVESYLNYLFPYIMKDNQLLPDGELELAVRPFLSGPSGASVIGRWITPDQKICLMNVNVRPHLKSREAMEKTQYFENLVKSYAAEHGIFDASITGGYSTSKDMQKIIDEDNRVLLPAAVAMIIAILALAFRRVTDVVLPFAVIALAAVWVLGMMGYLGIVFTTVAVAVLPLLMGISIAYAIHIISRYNEERSNGKNASEAVVSSIKNTGTAVFLTAATTAIGFASWLISDLPPLRDFGLLCMLGIMFSFALTITLLPAFLVIRDRKKRAKKVRGAQKLDRSALDRGLANIAATTKLHPKGVVIAAGAITAVALILATQTTTAISFEELLPSGIESIRVNDEIRQNFGGQDLIIVLIKGDVTDPKVLETMIWLEQHVRLDNRNVKDERVYVTRAYSVADMVLMAGAGSIPQTSQEVAAILENLRHQTPHVDRLVTPDNDKTIVLFYCDARSDAELKLTADIVRDWIDQLPDNQAEFVATGTPVVAADLLSKIPQDALNTTLMALALCAVVLCIVFKSIGVGLIAMVPICLALMWQFGTFYVLDVPLNVVTVLISALLVGIGIDFSIHTTHRYLEEVRDRRLKPEGAVHATVLHVGRALLPAAATTCGAFGLLVLSRMPIMRTFGSITALAILYCMLAALLVLPSLLVAYTGRRMVD